MKKYQVELSFMVTRTIYVEANSKKEALDTALRGDGEPCWRDNSVEDCNDGVSEDDVEEIQEAPAWSGWERIVRDWQDSK